MSDEGKVEKARMVTARIYIDRRKVSDVYTDKLAFGKAAQVSNKI